MSDRPEKKHQEKQTSNSLAKIHTWIVSSLVQQLSGGKGLPCHLVQIRLVLSNLVTHMYNMCIS